MLLTLEASHILQQTARSIDDRSDLVSLLFQTTGPSHIPRHDELFQNLLSHYNVWIHVDRDSEAMERGCQLTIAHAPRTSNLAALIWNVTSLLQQVSSSREIDAFTYVGRARSIAGCLRLTRLLLHSTIASYVGAPRRTNSSSMLRRPRSVPVDRLAQCMTYRCRTNDTETDVGPLFVNALVDYLAFAVRHPQNHEYDYDARCETIKLMLVLLSTQLYSPLQSSFAGGDVADNTTVTAYSFWKSLISRGDVTLVLLNLTIERPQPTIRSIQYHTHKKERPIFSSTTSLLFWLPYRLVSLAYQLWRSGDDDPADDGFSTASNGRNKKDDAANQDSPLADLATALLLLVTNAKRAFAHQIRLSLSAMTDSRYSTDTKYRINFEDWFDSFERTLHERAAALWFYTVLQASPQFHEFLTLRSDLDRLVLPLLQTTSREIFHLYMILILLLLFSQEPSFGNDAFRRIQVDEFSLGTVILLAVVDLMESYNDDEFLKANCHAVITNLAASAVDLPAEEALMRHAYLLDLAIQRRNPEFVLGLMKKLDAHHRVKSNSTVKEIHWIKRRDEHRLKAISDGLDLRRQKKEILLQAITTRLKDREAAAETFTYQEEEDPEIFFVPYAWQVVVESSTILDMSWDRRYIKVFDVATRIETDGENHISSGFARDVSDVV